MIQGKLRTTFEVSTLAAEAVLRGIAAEVFGGQPRVYFDGETVEIRPGSGWAGISSQGGGEIALRDRSQAEYSHRQDLEQLFNLGFALRETPLRIGFRSGDMLEGPARGFDVFDSLTGQELCSWLVAGSVETEGALAKIDSWILSRAYIVGMLSIQVPAFKKSSAKVALTELQAVITWANGKSYAAINLNENLNQTTFSITIGEHQMDTAQQVSLAEPVAAEEHIAVTVVLGDLKLTLADFLALRPGSVIEFPYTGTLTGALAVQGNEWARTQVTFQENSLLLELEALPGANKPELKKRINKKKIDLDATPADSVR